MVGPAYFTSTFSDETEKAAYAFVEPHPDIITDIEAGGSVESQIRDIIAKHDVILFSKTKCPFCFELKRTLQSYGIHYALFEVNTSASTSTIQDSLLAISGIRTVPNLFVKGVSLGGCTDVKTLEHTDAFLVALGPFVGKEIAKPTRISRNTLFYFPEVVDAKVVRLTSFLSSIYCAWMVGFYRAPATKWAVLVLCIDYAIRLFFGGKYSAGGSLASVILANVTPKWTAGPPRQFAVFCGLFFSFFSAALHLAGYKVGGTVLMCALFAAAAIEGVFDFCLGCFFFGLGIDFGLIPSSVYRPYLNSFNDKKWAYTFSHTKYDLPAAETKPILAQGQTESTAVDLKGKIRFETEYKTQDYRPIAHARVDLFAIPMSISALAYVFKLTDIGVPGYYITHWNTDKAFDTLIITSIILFGFIFFLYLLHSALYPRKVWKEWNHPISGNFFSTLTINVLLYGFAYMDRNVTFAGVLIWIGAAGQMLLTLWKVGDLVYKPLSEEFLTPSTMMSPVGNFIAAIGFCLYDKYHGPDFHGVINYTFIGRIWYSVAALFAIVLFTITFKKSMFDHHSEPRTRFTLWIWLATSSTFGVAYLAVSNWTDEAGKGVLFQSLYGISLFFYSLLGLGWLRNFFIYPNEIDMAMWIVPFSFAACSLITIEYFFYVRDPVSRIIAIISLATTCASIGVSGFYTIQGFVDGSIFLPRSKWGPVNFMKLTHEAFRFAIPNLANVVKNLNTISGNPAAFGMFLAELEAFFAAYEEHSRHEDFVLFPAIRRFFPKLNLSADEEHEHEHIILNKFLTAIEDYKNSKNPAELVQVLQSSFDSWGEHVLNHLRNEEASITIVARKYLPMATQKVLVNEVLDLTPAENWAKIIPYVVSNLPVHTWKIRFLRTFIWANPARAQEIGLFAYRGLDSVQWNLVAAEIPELIPRGVDGYSKIY